ncbi:MAG: hypothetical protein HY535_05025 [Chloroflexi bacterium]|nr:hypothetical protein [Chloroflexota bacterium]
MLWFRECPRCGGDLYRDRDMYGRYIACLQCGYYLSDAQMEALERMLATAQEPERAEAAVAA